MLKVKLKESALVNANRTVVCSLKLIDSSVNGYYTLLSRVRIMNAVSVSVTIWKSAYWGPVYLEIIVWSSKRSIYLVVLIILLISTLRLFC